jgi:galactitol-specific phosphotransferase system IIB component
MKSPGTTGKHCPKTLHNNKPIRLEGSIEKLADGDVREFNVSRYAMFFLSNEKSRMVERAPRRGAYPVFFVNGMQGSPAKFRAQACAVAAATGGVVRGVYNGQGTSFLVPDAVEKYVPDIAIDLIECATDKVQSTDLDQFKVWMKKKFGQPQSKIEKEMIENLSKYNSTARSASDSENARVRNRFPRPVLVGSWSIRTRYRNPGRVCE